MEPTTRSKTKLFSALGFRRRVETDSHRQPSPLPKIALPGYFLHWLGIDNESLIHDSATECLDMFSFVESEPFPGDDSIKDSCSVNASDFQHQLAEAIDYATCVQSECMICQLSDEHCEIRSGWQSKLSHRLLQYVHQFQRERPDLVLLVQGFEPSNACARIAAQHLEIPFVALENSALSDRMLWDNVSGITTNRNLSRNQYWRYKDTISDITSNEYCERIIVQTGTLKSAEHTSPRHAAPAREHRPNLLFLGQVFTDSSVLFGLNEWKSPIEIVQQCRSWCEQNGFDLIVKLHPKEATGNDPILCQPYRKLTSRKLAEDGIDSDCGNSIQVLIDEDNEWNTYELINNSDIVVTLNSQSGLEAAIRSKPVVVCGDAFYGNLGFTFDAPGPAFFPPALEMANSDSLTPEKHDERVAKAKQFFYVFFEKYCRKKNVAGLVQLIEENLP